MPSYADSPETLHILQDFPAVRLERLSGQPDAFIRPSPFRGYLGGVACRTRECILIREAAGYRNVLVETVGVDQSALENTGIRECWQMILEHRAHLEAGGHLERRRQTQALNWMHELIAAGLHETFQNAGAVPERLAGLERSVRERMIGPSKAARELLRLYQI